MAMEVDWPGNSYEYATLACRCSTGDRVVTTTVNLKVAFSDVGPIVLLASVIVVADVTSGGVRVYEGCVSRDQAATMSRSKISDNDESIRVWLQDARTALIGQSDSDKKPLIEYAYYLEELPKSEDDGNVGRLQLFSWKMKLQPVGQVKLGAVNLTEVMASTSEQLNQRFVEPLISRLSSQQRDRNQSNRLATENTVKLLDDNRRLLDDLRSITESQKRYDQKLMAKFVKILNEKKKRLAAVEQELSELKHRDDGSLSIAVESMVEKSVTMTSVDQLRGRSVKKTKLNNDEVPIKKKQRTTYNDKTKQSSFFSDNLEQKNQADSMDVIGLRLKLDDQQHKFGLMEMDNLSKTDDSNLTVNNMGNMKAVVEVSPTTVSIPIDYDVFAADTQIDNIMSDGSPPWLQNSIPPLPVSHKDDNHQQSKKNVIDSLWAGLL
ncbi:DNA repair protein XRCC4 [Cinara cedri]|uniref:DNA repair protein XRCC4 n=1 Tax=Cinara cedri TaxID=506608 RepID=A0A5E4M1K8_9HEMI|nr:DNA repair protein XRCC4 [Cinara cedri]